MKMVFIDPQDNPEAAAREGGLPISPILAGGFRRFFPRVVGPFRVGFRLRGVVELGKPQAVRSEPVERGGSISDP